MKSRKGQEANDRDNNLFHSFVQVRPFQLNVNEVGRYCLGEDGRNAEFRSVPRPG